MKILISIVSILLWGCFSISAQDIEPTTEVEYNYGAVGYRIQLQAGMSDKTGYHIDKIDEYEEDERKMEMMGMFRDGEKFPCAVIMVFTRIRTAPLYFCIPSRDASEELWTKFHNSLTTGTDNPQDQLHFFSTCIAKLSTNYSLYR